MVDVIEAPFQISIQDILGLVIDDGIDCCDGIMTGASRAKPIAIGFETCLPCGF